MSYILDALKKADAERERAVVPGLHAHPQDGLSAAADHERRLPWPALAVGAVLLLGGALVWTLLSDRGVRTPPLTAGAEPTAPTAPAAPPLPAPSPPPAATPAMPTLPAAPPMAAEAPPPTVVVRPPPAPPPTAAPPTAAMAPPPAAAQQAASAPSRVPALAELPADVRASLPPLAISGAVYSPTPSARMIFIGGQVLREGDPVADGVLVERIGASASVLSVRGQKFEVKH